MDQVNKYIGGFIISLVILLICAMIFVVINYPVTEFLTTYKDQLSWSLILVGFASLVTMIVCSEAWHNTKTTGGNMNDVISQLRGGDASLFLQERSDGGSAKYNGGLPNGSDSSYYDGTDDDGYASNLASTDL